MQYPDALIYSVTLMLARRLVNVYDRHTYGTRIYLRRISDL
ncbi:hypothetical protein BH09PAT3_BH09PAT3_1060 [soil metagenome]